MCRYTSNMSSLLQYLIVTPVFESEREPIMNSPKEGETMKVPWPVYTEERLMNKFDLPMGTPILDSI